MRPLKVRIKRKHQVVNKRRLLQKSGFYQKNPWHKSDFGKIYTRSEESNCLVHWFCVNYEETKCWSRKNEKTHKKEQNHWRILWKVAITLWLWPSVFMTYIRKNILEVALPYVFLNIKICTFLFMFYYDNYNKLTEKVPLCHYFLNFIYYKLDSYIFTNTCYSV